MEEVKLTEVTTGLAIREFLQIVGEAGPNDFYKAFRKVKPSSSYNSCRRYFWICKKLGLIEPTRREMGKGYIPKQLYRIAPGMSGDPRWGAPQIAMYPETRLGARRYAKR
ncbi:hypothetical protein ES702_03862 [subsurface metagenome]